MQDNNLSQEGFSVDSNNNHIVRNVFVGVAVIVVIIIITLAIVGKTGQSDLYPDGQGGALADSEKEEISRALAEESTGILADSEKEEILEQMTVEPDSNQLTDEQKAEILRQLAQ